MRRLSLQLRLALAGAVAVLLAMVLAAAGLTSLFSTHVERQAVAELSRQLDRVIAGLGRQDGEIAMMDAPAESQFDTPYGGLYWQVERPQAPSLRSRSLWDTSLELPDPPPDGSVLVTGIPGPQGAPLLGVVQQVTLPPEMGGDTVQVAVAIDQGELVRARASFVAQMTAYLALLGMALVAAGAAQLAIGLRPLRILQERVGALRAGQARRVGGGWPSEVEPLAEEIDALLATNEAEMARARARAGDLAHGLKTPLQALMGEADRIARSGLPEHADVIESLAATMRRHVDRELVRSRSVGRHGRADLSAAVAGVVSVLKRLPDVDRLSWRIKIPEGMAVALDEADLAEAIGALAENAVRHAVSEVRISAWATASHARLSIADDGPGISSDRIAMLAAKALRLDETIGGLGLTIARDVAEDAGGALELENGSPGLVATLVLPLATATKAARRSTRGHAEEEAG